MPLNGSIMYVIICEMLPEIKSIPLDEIDKINTKLQNKDEMFHFPPALPVFMLNFIPIALHVVHHWGGVWIRAPGMGS